MSTALWYDRFVEDWLHALPLGNGRVGAMLYGNPHREVIEINEESLWSGQQIRETNHATPDDLSRIRKLIFENRLREAAQLSRETFLASPPRVRFYESFGEVILDFADKREFSEYRKELELSEATAYVTWKKGNTTYRSTCLISEAYDALAYRVEALGDPFSCTVTIKRGQDSYLVLLNAGVNWYETKAAAEFILDENNELTFRISSLTGNVVYDETMVLDELPERKIGTTRIRLEMKMVSENTIWVEVADLGFGEFYLSTGKKWEKEIVLEIKE